MKNIIPKDTRYLPFTQQHSCCVPATISVVMYKLGLPLMPQELLGYDLGLILDKKHKNLFWNVRVGKRPPAGYGTRMYEKKYEANSVFKKLKIPLKITSHEIDAFKTKAELVRFLDKGIGANKDFIAILNSDVLNNTNNNNGHACVIDRIYLAKNLIRLIDPSPKQAKWREITINKLIKAIKLHPAGKGRILELTKIK
jgi:hypothetical protein